MKKLFSINNRKIQSRIVFTTVTSLLVMCLLVSFVCFFVFSNYLRKSQIKSSEAGLTILSESIDTKIDSVYRMARFCQTSSAVADYIKENPNPSSVLAVATFDRVLEEYNNNPAAVYIPRLSIVTGEHFLQIVNAMYSSSIDLAKEIPAQPYFRELLDSKDFNLSTGFIKDPFYRNGVDVIPIIRPITYRFNSVQGGYLFMEITPALFTEAFEAYSVSLMEDSNLFLTISDLTYIYKEGSLTLVDEMPEDIVSKELKFPDCTISQSISSAELRSEASLLFFVMIGIIFGILTIGVVMVIMLNAMISKPVSKLQAKMSRVSAGNFERTNEIEWNHELGDIGRGINDLAENINLLMESRLEDEKQKRELEYQVLLNQINPHFIYNTLNSIKWMATVQGADGISEMTTSLAKLLKSISKGTASLVTIEEELSLLQDYFTIQKYRYGGTINLEIECADDALKQNSIIKFTLQPIVENAIFHGIEPKGHGTIKITVSSADDDILITVYDDGVGMNPEKADSILTSESHEKSDFFKELGIKNVHKRLQYEFGTSYGLSVESKEGEYTKMFIHLPKVQK